VAEAWLPTFSACASSTQRFDKRHVKLIEISAEERVATTETNDHQMVNLKTRYFVHGGIKTLQFMFGRNILHFERHKQRQFTQ
jgi:hypothetical protein